MRINGSSGLDIDSMVSQLMKVRKLPLDKYNQKKQTLEWQRDEYRSMNSKLLEFKNSLFNMKLQSNYLVKKAASSDTGVVTATGTANAGDGAYTIRVKSLAESASLTSGDVITMGAGNAEAKMSSLGLAADKTLNVTGEKGTASIVIKADATITEVVKTVNEQSSATGVKMSYDANLDRFFFSSTSTGANAKIKLDMADGSDALQSVFKLPASNTVTNATGAAVFSSPSQVIDSSLVGTETITFNYDGQAYSFNVDNTTTIGGLISQINNSSLGSLGFQASLSNNKLQFSNPSGKALSLDVLDPLKTSLGLESTSSKSTTEVTGKNAVVVFNGVQGEFASNNFTINGISFTANRAQLATETEVRVTVSQDVDAVVTNIKSFVEKYNQLIETVNKKTSEERFRDFAPITDDQRKDMKEDDIKRWEEKAKSGLLKNDSILTSGLSKFRLTLMGNVSGLPARDVDSLTEVGITTGSYQENGKLYLDETKLRKALTDNPEQVMNLFTATDNNAATTSADGIATRLYDEVTNLMSRVTEKAGSAASLYDKSFLGKDIENIKKDISSFSRRLIDIENRYYKQFSAMETAMNKLNAQSSSLMQKFGQ
ncbi:flagellar filament capping protein FliD [Paenibacillus sp. CC-CFT747]|nr:flagellar filament capping protein FliD [Paenibacillus sp. CC-CFT747]